MLPFRRIAENPDASGRMFFAGHRRAFSGVVRSVSSIAVLANFLFARAIPFSQTKSGFCRKFDWLGRLRNGIRRLSIGSRRLAAGRISVKPSEFFQRQCYFTCWYDRKSMRVRHYPGTANILWSRNFPLATSTMARYAASRGAAFAEVPEAEKRQIQWENAAKLYSL